MKRSVGILAGMALTGVTVYLGAKVWAQQPTAQPVQPTQAAPARPLRTRIALVNMAQVTKNYKKALAFQEELVNQAKQIDATYLAPLRNDIVKKQELFQKPDTPQAQKEQLERELRKHQLDFQEKEQDARKRLSTMQSEKTVQLYREIEDAVNAFAKAQDYELVLFYTDPTNPQNPWDPNVIQRRLAMGACLPMYAAPGMDISDYIAANLNSRLGPPAAMAPSAPPAGQPAVAPQAGQPVAPHQ